VQPRARRDQLVDVHQRLGIETVAQAQVAQIADRARGAPIGDVEEHGTA
jgi:hypothetical protein